MNWNQIFQNIGIPAIVSAIVSGGIAFLAYRSQKKIDYAYDYKKYILEKRKSAYDEIEKLING